MTYRTRTIAVYDEATKTTEEIDWTWVEPETIDRGGNLWWDDEREAWIRSVPPVLTPSPEHIDFAATRRWRSI